MEFRAKVAYEDEDETVHVYYLESKNYSLFLEDARTPGRIGYQSFLSKESNKLTFANCNGFCGIEVYPEYYDISLCAYGEDKGSLTIKQFDLEEMYSAVRQMFNFTFNG